MLLSEVVPLLVETETKSYKTDHFPDCDLPERVPGDAAEQVPAVVLQSLVSLQTDRD